jgi:type II secretory pathway component PulF
VTALIQPMVILVVALFVGLVAYSMITGILTTVSGLPKR